MFSGSISFDNPSSMIGLAISLIRRYDGSAHNFCLWRAAATAAAACTLQPRRAGYYTAPMVNVSAGLISEQFDASPVAFRIEQLSEFCVRQARKHAGASLGWPIPAPSSWR
ncbi:hypothetical protein [Cupriavidus necator]|uniref:hypothetical protein n=1 Tax=Cupriavidus necator TaxID=106590 RepID=UPI0012D2F11A|nr:hypothetical protein [Cupriavidus necator]